MNKIALVTGATAGIGEATALLLAQNNYDVIITGRRQVRLTDLSNKLEKEYGVKALSLCFDVRDAKAVEEQIKAIPNNWRKIDVLVNNAGLAVGREPIQDGLFDDWDRMIDTNVKGLLYMSKCIANLMIEEEIKGQIVNISSIAGKQVYANGNVYCASKHAATAISKALRIDLLHHGIRVCNISPGAAETEFSIVRYKGDAERAKSVYHGYEALTAHDIAETVLFAISRPAHVGINEIEITPTAQASSYYTDKNI